jgi:hypothetical protein
MIVLSTLLTCNTVEFCSANDFQILLVLNGQNTRCLAKSKYSSSFARTVVEKPKNFIGDFVFTIRQNLSQNAAIIPFLPVFLVKNKSF